MIDGREDPESLGEVANRPQSTRKLASRLEEQFHGEALLFCYEAVPCGYVLYRQLRELGHRCRVAPSRVPKAPGDRVKTDRMDAFQALEGLKNAPRAYRIDVLEKFDARRR